MQVLIDAIERARQSSFDRAARIYAGTEEPPSGYMPPDEPIYSIPPEEREAEISILAAMLADSRDWSHTNLGIVELFNKGINGAGCRVIVCDTGVDDSHPDLKPNIVPELCRDWTGSSGGFRDVQGHGTHCCGIIGATSNGAGIIGVAPNVELGMQKVLGDNGSGASRWIANGMNNAIALKADIISLSLGGSQPDPYTRAAVDRALQENVWVVAAAGNDGGPADSYPGNYPGVLCVAATDRNDQRASFSTINQNNDVSAPGVSIMSTLPKGRYGTMSGTSMATPAVAGCLALYRGRLKQLGLKIPTMPELLKIIARTAKDIAPPGPDSRTGSGLLAIGKMIAEISSQPPQPPFPPDPGTPGVFDVRLRIDPSRKTVEQVAS